MQLSVSIRVFSAIQIFLGLCSIILQIVLFHFVANWHEVMYDYDFFFYLNGFDCGIWAGASYAISGIVGVVTSTVQKQKLLISTVIFAALCVPVSIVAGALTVLDTLVIVGGCDPRCGDWPSFEIALATSTVMGLVGNLVLLVLASIQTSCCRPRQNSSTTQQIMTIYHPMYIIADQPQQTNQKP